jgi:hypothetical protein
MHICSSDGHYFDARACKPQSEAGSGPYGQRLSLSSSARKRRGSRTKDAATITTTTAAAAELHDASSSAAISSSAVLGEALQSSQISCGGMHMACITPKGQCTAQQC